MTSYLLAGPASEPVSLAEAKAFLRLSDTAEDGFVATLIAAARTHVESLTGRALLPQTWRLVLDCWPLGRSVNLPVTPLRSLVAITAYREDGEAVALDLGQFETGADAIRLPRTIAGMPMLQEHFGIEIDYLAGMGAAAGEVPAPLRQALLSLVGHWFEHRDAVIMAGAGGVVPGGFDRVLAPFRQVRL